MATAARLTDWGDPTGSRAVWPLRGKTMFTKRALKLKNHFAALARDEAGQALTEYALILALVSLVGLGLSPLGQTLAQMINDIAVAI